MIVRRIVLENYRNLAAATVEFSEGMNVLWGRNAQGKSNLLESVYFFARGKSFRLARDRELIRFGADSARMTMECLPQAAVHPLTLEAVLPAAGRRRLTENGAAVSSAEMIGAFRAVLFCPAHLTIVSGAPAQRRSFLDIAVSQLSPAYIEALSRYTRFLAERNALLRAADGGARVSDAEWETYADRLSEYGAVIASLRQQYLRLAGARLARTFSEMTAGAEIPAAVYTSHCLDPDAALPPEEPEDTGIVLHSDAPLGRERLRRLLTENIGRDIRAGATLHGIHKDDVVLTLNGRDARLYASQGQQRSLALALKLAEGGISRAVTGEAPVFLLDDVLSELDEERRRYILRALTGRQIIVTSCEPALFREAEGLRMWRVEAGQVSPLDT